MLLKETVNEVINNFNQQLQLYTEMMDLSARQLEFLSKTDYSEEGDELNQLLAKRQNLIKEINRLNRSNRKFRQRAAAYLEIDDFVLSQLQYKLDPEQFFQLQQVLAEIERILSVIADTDGNSEELMRKNYAAAVKAKPRANHTQASKAYNQAKNKG